jgi:hypothetical protein
LPGKLYLDIVTDASGTPPVSLSNSRRIPVAACKHGETASRHVRCGVRHSAPTSGLSRWQTFPTCDNRNKRPKGDMWSSYDLPCRVAKHAEGVPAALRTKLGWPLSNCMPAISTRRPHTGPCSPLGVPRPSRAGCRRRRCAVSTILAPQRRKGEQKNRP